MGIKLVVFDADKTLWSHSNVSDLTLPFKLVRRGVISDANGETFHLFEGIVRVLEELQNRNVIVALASWNKLQQVEEALRLFEIDKFFKFVKAEFHPKKHLLIEAILSELSQKGVRIRPVEILYVDDRTLHLKQVRRTVGPLRFLHMWVDAKTPAGILEHL